MTLPKARAGQKLSREERLAKVRPQRYKADKQIREILSDSQKKKLDHTCRGRTLRCMAI